MSRGLSADIVLCDPTDPPLSCRVGCVLPSGSVAAWVKDRFAGGISPTSGKHISRGLGTGDTYLLYAFSEALSDESSARLPACPQALLTLRLELAPALALEDPAVAYSGAWDEGLVFVSDMRDTGTSCILKLGRPTGLL